MRLSDGKTLHDKMVGLVETMRMTAAGLRLVLAFPDM